MLMVALVLACIFTVAVIQQQHRQMQLIRNRQERPRKRERRD